MINLHNGNCLQILKTFESSRFDGVITDPPCASGGSARSDKTAPPSRKYTATKSSCPFPEFAGEAMDARSWTRFMQEVFGECSKVSKPGAVIAAFTDWRQLPSLTDALQWADWTWRGTAVWDKISSRPQKGRFRQQAEFVVWGSKGALPVSRPVPVLPGVFSCANTPGNVRLHMTQKPAELMRQLVKICLPGGEILDPFAGSGSTLEAAMLEGYDATGIEVSAEYYEAARKRQGL